MCPESFGGVRFNIILCMSCFNHVLSWDTLRRDAFSSRNIGNILRFADCVFKENETTSIVTGDC